MKNRERAALRRWSDAVPESRIPTPVRGNWNLSDRCRAPSIGKRQQRRGRHGSPEQSQSPARKTNLVLVVVVIDMVIDRMPVAGRAGFVGRPVGMGMMFMGAVGMRVPGVRRPVRVVRPVVVMRHAVMSRQVLVKMNRHDRKRRRQEADGSDKQSDAAVGRHGGECISAFGLPAK